jgi:hypothetical protein
MEEVYILVKPTQLSVGIKVCWLMTRIPGCLAPDVSSDNGALIFMGCRVQ